MNKFEKILLTAFFIEMFVGGGGRLIDFGFLSIRQVLFILLILTFMLRIIRQRAYLDKRINTFIRFNPLTILIYLLIGSFVFSCLVGIINQHSISVIVMDFLRVSFIGAYFPLAYYIADDRFSKERIVQILKYSALAVAIFTIVISLIGKIFFVTPTEFGRYYYFINGFMNDDLYFRPSKSVFYKSHLFVLIALMISLNGVLDKKYTKLDIAILIIGSVSLVWSETRGFLLAFMIAVLTILAFDARIISHSARKIKGKISTIFASKQFVKKLTIGMLVVIAVPFLFNYMTLERFETEVADQSKTTQHYKKDNKKKKEPKVEVNDESVNTRVGDILEGKRILSDPVHFILGTGYGTDIGGRVTGIEMSFLDIWIEQGFVGLAIWLILCLLIFYNYHVVYKLGRKISTVEVALLAAFMGMCLLTNINPFINNPLGITFFLVMLIISQSRKEKELAGGFK